MVRPNFQTPNTVAQELEGHSPRGREVRHEGGGQIFQRADLCCPWLPRDPARTMLSAWTVPDPALCRADTDMTLARLVLLSLCHCYSLYKTSSGLLSLLDIFLLKYLLIYSFLALFPKYSRPGAHSGCL